jgi:hypothetical protein
MHANFILDCRTLEFVRVPSLVEIPGFDVIATSEFVWKPRSENKEISAIKNHGRNCYCPVFEPIFQDDL